jgi:hypothetical protein
MPGGAKAGTWRGGTGIDDLSGLNAPTTWPYVASPTTGEAWELIIVRRVWTGLSPQVVPLQRNVGLENRLAKRIDHLRAPPTATFNPEDRLRPDRSGLARCCYTNHSALLACFSFVTAISRSGAVAALEGRNSKTWL